MATELLARPMAKKSAKPKRDDTTVKVDRAVANDAFVIARGLGMTLAEYVTMVLSDRLGEDAKLQVTHIAEKYGKTPPPKPKSKP